MPQHELDEDLPAYLVFMILTSVQQLKQLQPDHLLVKAVRDALDSMPAENRKQLNFNF